MKFYFLGGFNEQGRSALYIEGRSRFLIDFGVKKIEENDKLGEIPLLDFPKPDFVLLTHAHQDHSAMLPLLVEKKVLVPIYCTPPTKELTIQMCLNWYENYKVRGLESPYSYESLKELDKLFVTVPYYETFEPLKSTKVTFYPSGHVLGSAIVYVEDEYTIAHFGDTNFGDKFNLEPDLSFEAQIGIINGAYGDKIMDDKTLKLDFLKHVRESQRTVLIPCAALGRGQEICLLLIENFVDKPIYVAKSVINNAKKMLEYTEYLRPEAPELIRKILTSDEIEIVDENNLQQIVDRGGVIIGPDAMLSSGIALKVFKLIKDNVQDTILLNGYLAPGTLGKKLITKEVSAGAAVKYAELKAHVDLEDNKRIIEKTLSDSKLILIHHGEEPKSFDLARALKNLYPNLNIKVPRVSEQIIL